MIIYKATNKINGKIYIGKTMTTLKRRMSEHKRRSKNSNMYFHNAIRKYGIENFDFCILCECNNVNDLNLKEIELIKQYNSRNRSVGYNLSNGGEGMGAGPLHYWYGKKRPELSKLFSGEGHPNFGNVGEKSPRFGQHHSEQSKQKISKSLKGKLSGNKNPSYDETMYSFHHDVFGTKISTKYYLRKSFNLDKSSLSSVCNGKRKQHKGWKMICCVSGIDSQDKQKCGEALRIVSGKTERVIKSLNHKTKKLIKRGNPLALAGG
jgi:group I intron endonuclease